MRIPSECRLHGTGAIDVLFMDDSGDPVYMDVGLCPDCEQIIACGIALKDSGKIKFAYWQKIGFVKVRMHHIPDTMRTVENVALLADDMALSPEVQAQAKSALLIMELFSDHREAHYICGWNGTTLWRNTFYNNDGVEREVSILVDTRESAPSPIEIYPT